MVAAKRFQRTKEDFTCEQCGNFVQGSGYTNHCPKCLWSKHVDVHPGDRQASCGGAMEPVSVLVKSGEFTVSHRCRACGGKSRNKTARDDDIETVIRLSKNPEKMV